MTTSDDTGFGIGIIGLQWGDEGKGKVLDSLVRDSLEDGPVCTVRYQGGANAGHTVFVGDKKYVLHLVPTGILHPKVTCIIGNGAVVDPWALIAEMDELTALGISLKPLIISAQAHLVMPYHKAIDAAREARASDNSNKELGTTKRGIGPCYADKAARQGIRFEDLYQPSLSDKLLRSMAEKNALLAHHFRYDETMAVGGLVDHPDLLKALNEVANRLAPHVWNNAGNVIRKCYARGFTVLFEGAQGVMLDIDHGTYPYVTSSSASSGGIANGAGVPPKMVDEIFGVAKCYTTRVGEGPFPTEMPTEEAAALRDRGKEFGATTGRPRRCGWLDLKQLKYAVELSGTTGIILTKLDTLAGLGSLKVCTDYTYPETCDAGLSHPTFSGWEYAVPVYQELEAIPEVDWFKVQSSGDLPPEAKNYVSLIENYLGVPVHKVSIGPERDSIIDWTSEWTSEMEKRHD